MKKSSKPTTARNMRRKHPRARRSTPKFVSLVYVLVAAALVVGAGLGFTGVLLGSGQDDSTEAQLPKYVVAAARDVREAYVYAMERPDVLQYVPCYCGCGQHSGHQSNWNCFIRGQNLDGTFVFDDHGAG